MFMSLLSRRLANGFNSTLMNTALRLYSCKKECPKTYPCVMEYPKKKCGQPDCQPKEPSCLAAFTECTPMKPDPCKPKPECCGSKKMHPNPCTFKGGKSDIKSKNTLDRNIPKPISAWEWPIGCCKSSCPDQVPRFDTIYYSPSDKEKRQYQQTWVECPPVMIKKRKICCYDPTVLPPICRRPKQECPTSACEFDQLKMKALCCTKSAGKCPCIPLPCCRGGRKPPKCSTTRRASECKKKCCPYPAFSECCSPCPKPKRPVECHCLQNTHLCLVYRHLKRKLEYSLPPPLPAWPPKMTGPR